VRGHQPWKERQEAGSAEEKMEAFLKECGMISGETGPFGKIRLSKIRTAKIGLENMKVEDIPQQTGESIRRWNWSSLQGILGLTEEYSWY
jgi:hypothetical protein